MSTRDDSFGAAEVNRLQRWFQAVITHADGVDSGAGSEEAQRLFQLAPGQLEKVITRSRALTPAERLAIYANAYHTRLLECLGEVFPMLKRTLGDEAFDGFAFGYLQEYPSRSYTLNELGRHFPRYLQETRPKEGEQLEALAAHPADAHPSLSEHWPDFLIGLAQLEWAIYEVFDGLGVEGQPLLRVDDLLDIPPERWPEAQLEPAPCLQLLTTRFPVNDYYTRLRQVSENQAVPIPAPDESFVAISRRDFVVRRYNLSRTEFELLRAIQQGLPLGQAIERAAQVSSESVDELASNFKLWFRNWTAEGFFRGIKLPGDNTRTANHNEHEH
jgi:putative DNA-binding protein